MRDIICRIVDDMHLHATDAAIPLGPFAHRAQWNRAGVDQADHLGSFAPRLPVNSPDQHCKGLCKHTDRTSRIRIRQRGARKLLDRQMIVMLGVGIEAGLQRTQTVGTAQLRIDQGHEMIPTLERLVVSIGVQPIDNRLNLPSIDRLENIPKNAIGESHARPLSESRQPARVGLGRFGRACTATQ